MPPRPLALSSSWPPPHVSPPDSSPQLAQTRPHDSATRCAAENRMRAALVDYLTIADVPGRVVRAVANGERLDFAVRAHGEEAVVGLAPSAQGQADCRASRTLVIDPAAESFMTTMGTWLHLRERTVLHRLFTRLLECRCSEAPRSMSATELIASVWPDEDIEPSAGTNRLHVAVAILRKLGLHGILLRRHDGYCLDPNVPIRVEAPASD